MEIRITNVLATGTAFAVVPGTPDSVFIPASLGHARRVMPGMMVDATLVENPYAFQPGKPRWMATDLRRLTDVPPMSTDDFIDHVVRANRSKKLSADQTIEALGHWADCRYDQAIDLLPRRAS